MGTIYSTYFLKDMEMDRKYDIIVFSLGGENMEKHIELNTSKWQELDQYILEKYIPRSAFAPKDFTRPSSNVSTAGRLKKMPRGTMAPLEMERHERPLFKNERKEEGVSKYPIFNSFKEMLKHFLTEKNIDRMELGNLLRIDSNTLSNLENDEDYKPKKEILVLLCFGLKLKVEQALDFLSKKGYSLSYGIKKDVIIRYFLEKENYNIDEVNLALKDYGFSKLFEE